MEAAQQAPSQAAEETLEQLSPEDLAACARLLALSLAHHRSRFGVIPLGTTRSEINQEPPPPSVRELKHAAGAALHESVTYVQRDRERERERAAAPAAAGSEAINDLRRQMRISVSAAVTLVEPDSDRHIAATLRNISWGGAAVQTGELTAVVGDRVRLLLPAAGRQPIPIDATILRKAMVDDSHEFGLRFDSLDPDDEERLMEVLTLLMKSPDPDNRRSEVRLVQRLEVEYGDAGEFGAVLEDISSRGMMLTVPDPLEIDESLLISLSSVDTPFALNLRARVRHRTPVEDCGIEMYRIGLEFEHPSPRLHDRISAVLHELALVRLRDADAATVLDEIDIQNV